MATVTVIGTGGKDGSVRLLSQLKEVTNNIVGLQTGRWNPREPSGGTRVGPICHTCTSV